MQGGGSMGCASCRGEVEKKVCCWCPIADRCPWGSVFGCLPTPAWFSFREGGAAPHRCQNGCLCAVELLRNPCLGWWMLVGCWERLTALGEGGRWPTPNSPSATPPFATTTPTPTRRSVVAPGRTVCEGLECLSRPIHPSLRDPNHTNQRLRDMDPAEVVLPLCERLMYWFCINFPGVSVCLEVYL